jgi:SWI/SNF-related matrix-associated actin-dependent regulator 1 of chromatin subfamily A
MKTAVETNEGFRLQWMLPREEWFSVLSKVKAIPGATFEPNRKLWCVPASMRDSISSLGFQLQEMKPMANENPYPEGLRKYQIEALEFLKKNRGRGLIADEMGTGKTVMALAWSFIFPKQRPVLVIVRAPTKLQWKKQILKWVPGSSVYICEGQKPACTPKIYDFYIINWDILSHWTAEPTRGGNFLGSRIPPALIVSDEVQAISNPRAKRTKAWRMLCRAAPQHIALSGTPFTTYPVQFYSILHELAPTVFPNYYKFCYRYGAPRTTFFGVQFKGASNVDELKKLAQPYFIRRTKAEVLKELPAKEVEAVYLEQRQITKSTEQFIKELEEKVKSKLPLNMDTLYLYHDKRESVLRYVKDFLEDTDKKLIVFGWHKFVVDDLTNELQSYGALKYYGGMSDSERENTIKAFKSIQCRVIVANMAAGGVGIDGLQDVCDTAFFVEIYGSVATHAQAEDRLHRIGQNNSVSIKYLIAQGTVEEVWAEILVNRGSYFKQILGDDVSFFKLLLDKAEKLKQKKEAENENGLQS